MFKGSEFFNKNFISTYFFPDSQGKNKIELHYINNPDTSIRWIYPASLSKPLFLKFYNTATLKSKVFACIIEIAYFLRLKNLIKSGSIFTDITHIKSLLGDQANETNWALFTGTVGPGRKLISISKDINGSFYFTKIAFTEQSKLYLKNEIQSLEKLEGIGLNRIQIPKIISTDFDKVVLTDLKSKKDFRTVHLTPKHIQAILDLQTLTGNTSYSQTEYWDEISLRIARLKKNPSKIPVGLILKVEQLQNQLKNTAIFQSYFAHGDFTPWNVYVSKNKLALYDWELAGNQPALFDLFHFICQSGILVQKKNYATLRKEIEIFINSCTKNPKVDIPELHPRIYFSLYILSITTYYLNIYSSQKKWHVQVYWLLSFWNKALSEEIAYHSQKSYRKIFLSELFSHLSSIQYAFLKYRYANVEELPITSDVDLVITKTAIEKVKLFISQHLLVERFSIRKNTMMENLAIFFKDGSVLSIDLIHEIRWKSAVMLDAHKLINSAVVNETGIKVASKIQDLLYTWLFYILNKSKIPGKYFADYTQLSQTSQQSLLNEFRSILQVQENTWENIFSYSESHNLKAKNYLHTLSKNKGLSKIKNSLQYSFDVLKKMLQFKNGITITFSGVDGSGKSTVIQETQKLLEKQYRKNVVVIRHRPGILPILSAWKYGKKEAENRTAVQLPRKGKNKSILLSLVRFAYYYTDYLLGQFYIWFKYSAKGYVILYDRYYFDFINDPKRSNINLSASFIKKFYVTIFKPKLNFFLHAPVDVINSRKQELSKEDIIELTEKYTGLFQKFEKKYKRSKYISIQNIEIEKTLQTILLTYQNSIS